MNPERERQRNLNTIKEFNRVCDEQKQTDRAELKGSQKRVQNYIIDTQVRIGEGTFASVYIGKDVNKGREVAVKVTAVKTIEKMGIQHLFKEQLSIIQQLKHPNIVTCFEYFRTPNNCYTVYEYCEGGDLLEMIKKGQFKQKQDLLKANRYIKDIFQGLLYLSTLNIVHRDIKSANIFISQAKAKIGDFGFATRSKVDFKDASIGSPAYMAPEGLLRNTYGPKTDVWGFGMLVYEIIHGNTPFYYCQTELELKGRITIPINWDQIKAYLPSPLKRLILKCLKVDVEERPTFSQLLNDEYIQKLYASSGVSRHKKSSLSKKTADSEPQGVEGAITQALQPIVIEKDCEIEKSDSRERNNEVTEQNGQVSEQDGVRELQQNTKEEYKQKTNGKTKLEGIYIEDCHLLLKRGLYEDDQLSQVAQIMLDCLNTINQTQQDLIHHDSYLSLLSRITQEIYLITDHHTPQFTFLLQQLYYYTNYQEVNQHSQANYSEELIKEATQNLFQLIKHIQILIDKQELQKSKLKSQYQPMSLVPCGNLSILCYRLIEKLIRNQPLTSILSDCQQYNFCEQHFFICLYQIQLSRMDS